MILRLIGYGPLVGLSLLVALPALADDLLVAGTSPALPKADAPSVAAPDKPAPDAPAKADTAPEGDIDAPLPPDSDEPPADQPLTTEPPPAAEPEMPAPGPDMEAPAAETPEAGDMVPDDDDALPEEPAPASVDPSGFLADAYTTCISALESPDGAFDIFDAAEWWPEIDDGSETAYYRQVSGDKWIDGIGDATLFYSIEVFPTTTISFCSIAVDYAEAPIPVADLLGNRTLTGSVRRQGSRVFGIFEDASDAPRLFVQADQDERSGNFVLDTTYTARTPAADLPPVTAADWESYR